MDMGKAYSGEGNSVVYESAAGKKTVRTGGTRAWRNNNPGNLRNYNFSKKQGSIGEAGGFAVFPDYETGQKAIKGLLRTKTYNTLTVEGAIRRYAPPNENDTANYTQHIEKETDLKATQSMGKLSDKELDNVVGAIEKMEGYKEGKVHTEGSQNSSTVTVQPGDSLWGLAKKHNTTVDALQKANGMKPDDSRIKAGQALNLPGEATSPKNHIPAQPNETPAQAAASQRFQDLINSMEDPFGRAVIEDSDIVSIEPSMAEGPRLTMHRLWRRPTR